MVIRLGTLGVDSLVGTSGVDQLFGQSSGDRLYGGSGNDMLSGGEGRDALYGGAGDDRIYGYGSSDTVAGSGDIRVGLVANGFTQPVFLSAAPGDPVRVFVLEKGGQIKILDVLTGVTVATPFLTIPPGDLSTSGEQGLLGMAFHPDYATNGQFYVFVNNSDGDLEIRRYDRSAGNVNLADPNSGDVIMTIPHPVNSNHNGGWIGFGPDGYLYIATGDGGGGGDPLNNAQNPNVLLGKMLRIDVDGDDFAADAGRDYAIPVDNPFVGAAGADEIWATGLRNPWRPSFDRLTGDLYIADVGQDEREEVNFQGAGSAGGVNYGWAVNEGSQVFDPNRPGNPPPDSPLLTDPVIEYPHTDDGTGGFSVTGGYVYRGPGAGQSSGMQGVYLYADFVTNQVWSFRVVNGVAVDAENRTSQLIGVGGSVGSIASFGEDGRGRLYIVGLDGEIFRLTPQAGAGDGADVIAGGSGNDRIWGGVGNDAIFGGVDNDVLYGGGQDDSLIGDAGKDILYGGAGRDVFVFRAIADSPLTTARDIIADFTQGSDRIGLNQIDARPGIGGDQAFTYIGTAAFSGEGQIRAKQVGDHVVLDINVGGSFAVDMQLTVRDTLVTQLDAGDFIL